LNSWSAANTTIGSGISFSEGAPPSEPPSGMTSTPTVITFTQGSCPSPNIMTQTVYDSVRPDNTVEHAIITFCTASARTIQGNPYYDPNAPIPPSGFTNGYDSIFEKMAEHEIGHPMRLMDAPMPSSGNFCDQPSLATVMNEACGNDCPNDNCNHMPRGVTQCDNSVVQPIFHCDFRIENDCRTSGGTWDFATCTCQHTIGCNPAEANDCRTQGGNWDDASCSCGFQDYYYDPNYKNSGDYRCYEYYSVTDWYSVQGDTWTYLYSTYDYMGTECYLIVQ
jgi:hypothetical protein